jgi:hypothetical protein
MEYATGDTVKFRLKSGEIQKGDVVFIERSLRGNMLYINSSNRTAYRIPEKRIISSVMKRIEHESMKLKERLRKLCPECESTRISLNKSTKKYRC